MDLYRVTLPVFILEPRSMLERIMLDVMYDVPSHEDVAEVTLNRAVVEGKKQPIIRKKQDKDAA